MPGKRKTNKPKAKPFPFEQSLVLFKYILKLFNADTLQGLSEGMKQANLEGVDENSISRFYTHLTNQLYDLPYLTKERLLQYDQNIVRHTKRISDKRDSFRWKYFQYMALLFTEIYLDLYFQNPQQLLQNLNEFIDQLNAEREAGEKIDYYNLEDLNKVAFWQATGSGKTLLMHVNYLQYHFYLDKYQKSRDVNRTILLTPNEGLSEQHRQEFVLSGMAAEIFQKEGAGLFQTNKIEIIEVTKLIESDSEKQAKSKEAKSVQTAYFEDNNLVLVDEGHRGASSGKAGAFLQRRDELCQNGFSFEYSATFGQAVKGDKKLEQKYAKCVLFDYSYKHFYNDGYGKEYSILNLSEDQHEEQRQLYLTACMVSFYQQLKHFSNNEGALTPFYLEEPLWVFVGSKVNAVRTEQKREVSDVVDILLFLKEFIQRERQSVDFIGRLMNGESQLKDTRGNDLFFKRFDYLTGLDLSAQDIFTDIMRLVFNCDIHGADLHLDNLKGAQGEIGLRIGDHDHFGVINVGDDSKLLALCAQNGFNTGEMEFSDSLFRRIHEKHSRVKILIGSKKFTEGWNSWRVSTMGLMNVGKSEGSEIIQLFGRGVRLKGHNQSLKRSSRLPGVNRPKFIETVETLNIFGIKADYMKQFREYLEDEGVKNADDYEAFTLPTVKNLGKAKLKYPCLKEGADFKKYGEKPTLSEPDEYVLNHPVVLDWYPKIEAIQAKGMGTAVLAEPYEDKLTEKHIAFFDFDVIFFAIEQYKHEKNYFNMNIPKEALLELLQRKDWYTLYVPEEDLAFDSFEKVRMWQDMAIALLKKYCDRYYNAKRLAYLADKMELRYFDEVEAQLARDNSLGNLVGEYQLLVERSALKLSEDIIKIKEELEDLQRDLDQRKIPKKPGFNGLYDVLFDRHLYEPLLHCGKVCEVRVSPVALNVGEMQFVEDLRSFYENNADFFVDKELYLLRNLGRGRGVGFFEANNFYPDFILWIIYRGQQFITFIDPKGLKFCDKQLTDPKIQFFKKIKEIENRLGDRDVVLNSFIISVTSPYRTDWWGARYKLEELEDHHILFLTEAEDVKLPYLNKLFDRILPASLGKGFVYVEDLVPVEDENRFKKEFELKKDEKFKTYLPVYTLEAACGKFGQGQIVEPDKWIKVEEKNWGEEYFVCRAVGNSMYPDIKDGDYCIFKINPGGPYSKGRRAFLFMYQGQPDRDTGGCYTIKGYKSTKDPNGKYNVKVELLPFNKDYESIPFDATDPDIAQKLIFVGEFMGVVK